MIGLMALKVSLALSTAVFPSSTHYMVGLMALKVSLALSTAVFPSSTHYMIGLMALKVSLALSTAVFPSSTHLPGSTNPKCLSLVNVFTLLSLQASV
jgi:hypothetical protein